METTSAVNEAVVESSLERSTANTAAKTFDAFIRRLSASKFNYWFGYVANLSLCVWLASQAFDFSTSARTLSIESLLTGTAWIVYALAGLAFWSLTEYVFHRFFYHEWSSALQKGHGMHHEEPEALLGVPWYLTAIALVGIYFLMASIFPAAATGVVMSFAWLGYVGYCFIHHSIHHFDFKFAWFRALRKHHLIHHVHPEFNVGITSTFWDYAFGTKRMSVKSTRH